MRSRPRRCSARCSSWRTAAPRALAAKLAAFGTNAVTFVFAFGLLLVPGLLEAIRARRTDAAVRAFAGLLGLVFLFQSLVVTLHSTHGSYLHSLAAFVPFGVALGVAGSGTLLARFGRVRLMGTAGAAGVAAAIIL